jgi:glycosyltransferase involved in cell wall biosynthesis
VAMQQIVLRAAKRADALITGSAAARDEIKDVLGLDAQVVHHGAGRLPDVEPAPEGEVRARYSLGSGRFVLSVGAKRPHKNQELLLRALPKLPDDLLLVLAGYAEPYDDVLRRLARELGVDGRVRFTGYVPDAELEALWRAASCIAFPTLAEGFGLPLIEALQRGVPAAVSDIPVLREIGDDAVRYFDPRDPDDGAKTIAATLDDKDLASRGPEWAARFSWEKSARGTFEAYERAVAR